MERCNPFELLRAENAAPQDAEELRLAAEKKMDSLLGGASVVLVWIPAVSCMMRFRRRWNTCAHI